MHKLDEKQIRNLIQDCIRESLSSNFSENEIYNLYFKKTREWDSISHIRLMACLRSKFNINFTFEEMVKMTNFDEILRIISSRKSGGASK
jgi:acyl carrier protein